MRRLSGLSMAFFAIAGACGCSSGDSSPSNNQPWSQDAGTDSTFGQPEASAPEAGAKDACGQADDPLDDQGLDSNCDGADGVVGKDIYVDSGKGDDTNPGTPSLPMRSLENAIKRAAQSGGRVVLGAGEYPASQLTADSFAIWGGYDASFGGPPKRDRTVIKAQSPKGLAILDVQQVGFYHLWVKAPHAAKESGSGAYAMRFLGKSLELVDVGLEAGNAIDGQSGEPGAAGQAGRNDCHPLVCKGVEQPQYSAGSYAGMNNALGGLAGSVSAGRAAAAGGSGPEGTSGANATAHLLLREGVLVLPDGTSGQSNAGPGYGGAGGSSYDTLCHAFNGISGYLKLTGGCGGSGGCPGEAGTGSQSGGVSVALLILEGTAEISRSELHTGSGGQGGEGGEGGKGGDGGQQGLPHASIYSNENCSGNSTPYTGWPSQCTIINDPLNYYCALYGGRGGAGGKGGTGGGGAGGWTIGIASAPGTQVQIDSATRFELGTPGYGGTGGAGRAPDGQKRPRFELP